MLLCWSWGVFFMAFNLLMYFLLAQHRSARATAAYPLQMMALNARCNDSALQDVKPDNPSQGRLIRATTYTPPIVPRFFPTTWRAWGGGQEDVVRPATPKLGKPRSCLYRLTTFRLNHPVPPPPQCKHVSPTPTGPMKRWLRAAGRRSLLVGRASMPPLWLETCCNRHY